ncbi:DDE family transposase [Murinocardiopsis flavida]|uniref:DDE family transposase n=1 Tax=Murinocardiopsis flavida TaxID=645275 RepID=A0A2P8C552_9ACTN|nr:transposase [Murinocardiopsis flavida]PSK80095.1 DDE family transposase [Murinocardiopsis flavida]
MNKNLDALLTALYVYLDDHILCRTTKTRPGPGRPAQVTDTELLCLAVAQALLRYDNEHHWLRAAPDRVGHLFPRLLCQSEYNRRLRALAAPMLTAALWLARHTPTWAEPLRLMDGTPIRCGTSRVTTERSALEEYAGYGHDASHHCFYWGMKLVLITTADGAVCAFSLANPKELDERKQALHLVEHQPVGPGPTGLVCDKGFAGAGIEAAMAAAGHTIVRPARRGEDRAAAPFCWFPGWLRQRIEAVIWTLKNQLGLERHHARIPEGLWARTCQRVLALNAVIWHNWHIGAPVKRSLIAYDH